MGGSAPKQSGHSKERLRDWRISLRNRLKKWTQHLISVKWYVSHSVTLERTLNRWKQTMLRRQYADLKSQHDKVELDAERQTTELAQKESDIRDIDHQ